MSCDDANSNQHTHPSAISTFSVPDQDTVNFLFVKTKMGLLRLAQIVSIITFLRKTFLHSISIICSIGLILISASTIHDSKDCKKPSIGQRGSLHRARLLCARFTLMPISYALYLSGSKWAPTHPPSMPWLKTASL